MEANLRVHAPSVIRPDDDVKYDMSENGVMTTTAARPTSLRTTERFRFVDVLRGFALLGILFVNAVDISHVGVGWIEAHRTALPDDPLRDVLYATTQTRFVPIFNTLFGVSLFFVLSGARARAPRPWFVMVRRLVGLVAIGALLMLVYPGNVLTEYGVAGLVVLPVVLLTPRWVTLASGLLLTAAAYAITGGGLAATPGLMLLGAGLAAYGVPRVLGAAGRGVATVFVAASIASVPLLWAQLAEGGGDPRFSTIGGTAGIVMAVAYTTGLALLWKTPARRALAAFFEPLGRMALTNYVVAAVVFALAGVAVDFRTMTSVLPVVLIGAVLIVLQSVCSRLWLGRFAYGPVEWLWRTATWMRMAPWRVRR